MTVVAKAVFYIARSRRIPLFSIDALPSPTTLSKKDISREIRPTVVLCIVATDNAEQGGETRSGRLGVLLSSFWASLGGVFTVREEEIESEEENELDLEMASRVVAPEQPIVGGGKQKNPHPEARNRRVLRDIGNLVPAPLAEGKPHDQITRPITRRFGAQLLANGQPQACKARPENYV